MDQPTAVFKPPMLEPVVAAPAQRSRPRWPGILSFVLAVLTVVGLVTGLVLVVQDSYLAATSTAWVTTGVSVVAVLLGVVAIVGRFGRGWGIVAVVLAVIANPPALTQALAAIGGLWA